MIVIGFDTSARLDSHSAWKRLLRDMLSRFLSLGDAEIYKDENGKPRAIGALFSVSHSREVVMCALFVPETVSDLPTLSPGERISLTGGTQLFALECGECFDIGADTEHISARRGESRLKSISERYFTPEEIALVRDAGKSAFYRIWTEKESYLKLSGIGLRAIRTANTISLPDGISMLSFIAEHGGEEFSCSVCFQTK